MEISWKNHSTIAVLTSSFSEMRFILLGIKRTEAAAAPAPSAARSCCARFRQPFAGSGLARSLRSGPSDLRRLRFSGTLALPGRLTFGLRSCFVAPSWILPPPRSSSPAEPTPELRAQELRPAGSPPSQTFALVLAPAPAAARSCCASLSPTLRRLRIGTLALLRPGRPSAPPLQRYASRFRHGLSAAPCHSGVLPPPRPAFASGAGPAPFLRRSSSCPLRRSSSSAEPTPCSLRPSGPACAGSLLF